MIGVRWVWVFLDEPRATFEESFAFWQGVTGTQSSARRGEREQFLTLLPTSGDPWVKMQATGHARGIHLDLDVDDVAAGADHAIALGAAQVATIGDAVVVMHSPGGFPFCLTTTREPLTQSRDRAVLLDQVCLDLPQSLAQQERSFWADLTGWPLHHVSARPEFHVLTRPDGMPVRLLFQTLGEPRGPVQGHVDLACADRAQQVVELVAAGARVIGEGPAWTVLADPVGRVFCVTDRIPATGLL